MTPDWSHVDRYIYALGHLLSVLAILLLVVINFQIRSLRMGIQEDFATLNEKFAGMEAAQQLVADDIAALKAEIIALNQASNVDLSPLIQRAENIEAALRAAAGSSAGSGDV